MQRKIVWIAVTACIVAVAAIGWAYWPAQSTDPGLDAMEGSLKKQESLKSGNSPKDEDKGSLDNQKDPTDPEPAQKSSHVDDEDSELPNDSLVDRHRRASERGVSSANFQQYTQYDLETLRQLANQGDVTAINLYGRKMMRKNPDKAFEVLTRGAKLGSGDTPLAMAEAHDFYAKDTQGFEPPKNQRDWETRKHEVRQLGWLLFALKRGSASAAVRVSVFMRETELSGEDVKQACEFARSKYKDLESERINETLGEYNDTPIKLEDADRIRNADPCPNGLGFDF